jgi:3-oxoacyl-[acyl-carrier protein] reductase
MSRVVLITGSSRGLGRALALECGRQGDRVAVHCREQIVQAREVAEAVRALGGEVEVFQADVRVYAEVEAMVRAILRQWGRIDLLVNNAGVAIDALLMKTDVAAWEAIIGTNLTGAFHCLRAVAPAMMKAKKGQMINIGSVVGLAGRRGEAAYAASKAGLLGLTRTAAKELGRFGIQVNLVLPGFHLTDMGRAVTPAGMREIEEARLLTDGMTIEEAARAIRTLSLLPGVSGQVWNLDSRVF